MKTPSAYPVLDNRPIDQWKVTELKEELKRRKLTTRGLKEELVRRLDESLRMEMEAEKEDAEAEAEAEADNGVDDPLPVDIVVTEPTANESGDVTKGSAGDAGGGTVDLGNAGDKITNLGDGTIQVDNEESIEQPIVDKGQEQDSGLVSVEPAEEQDTGLVSVEPAAEQDSGVVSVEPTEEQDSGLVSVEPAEEQDSGLVSVEPAGEQDSGLVSVQPPEVGTLGANDKSVTGLGCDVSESLASENAVDYKGLPDGALGRDNEGSGAQEQGEDGKLDSSDPNNQVSEVSSSLGFPIKSNSISTDSVSINETNDLKDNIIADNDVKLESDVKPEMVQPSSSEFVPDGGNSHPSDVEEPQEDKVSVQETDNSVTNVDVSQKNYSADLGSSEKLNLDRSSGDDSMEEDALESKHIDSNYNSEEVVERAEKNEVTPIEEEKPVATMDIDEPEKVRGSHHENNVVDTASTDKRKLSDQDAVLSNEPTKRQRRWKSESNNIKEPQMSNVPLHAAVKDVPQPAVLKRNLSGSNSVGSVDEPPKEREVPPSSKPATDSLRIDRFLRPFTLKAVQELLAKTGTVTSFWMDHIKTHCYVTYSSVEEAVETRNAVYNLQWPPNGGRQLVAEFVDPEEVKARLEKPPQAPTTPVSSGAAIPEPAPTMPQPSPRQQNLRQQMSQQPTLPPPPPLSNPPQAREYAELPPPPPQIEKVEAPILTLDDLFKKTKATPRIYYLPLSDEQVAGVLEARRRNSNKQ